MAKNRKVKGFCKFCGDPVITGGKKYGEQWFHNPCYVANSYGMPQNIVRGRKPRRSAPPFKEIQERSEEGLNPMEGGGQNPLQDLEILAHAHNVTLASNPPGQKQMFYIWQGPRNQSLSIVRFPNYPQANQYYRDVIDGKSGTMKNPNTSMSGKTKFGIGAVSLVALAILIYWLYKRRKASTSMEKKLSVNDMKKTLGTGTVATDGFGGQN